MPVHQENCKHSLKRKRKSGSMHTTGGRPAVTGETGPRARSWLCGAALPWALPVQSPQPPSGDTALGAVSSTRAGAPMCPWDRPPGPGRHAGGREGTSLGVRGAHALLLYPVGFGPPHPRLHKARHSSGAPRSSRGTTGQEHLEDLKYPGAGVAEGPFLQAVTPDTWQS